MDKYGILLNFTLGIFSKQALRQLDSSTAQIKLSQTEEWDHTIIHNTTLSISVWVKKQNLRNRSTQALTCRWPCNLHSCRFLSSYLSFGFYIGWCMLITVHWSLIFLLQLAFNGALGLKDGATFWNQTIKDNDYFVTNLFLTNMENCTIGKI